MKRIRRLSKDELRELLEKEVKGTFGDNCKFVLTVEYECRKHHTHFTMLCHEDAAPTETIDLLEWAIKCLRQEEAIQAPPPTNLVM